MRAVDRCLVRICAPAGNRRQRKLQRQIIGALERRGHREVRARIEAAELYNSGQSDYFSISGNAVRVQAGGLTAGELGNELRLQEKNPERIEIRSSVQGRSGLSVTWIVTGTGTATLEYRSLKGGRHRTTVQLR